MSAESTQPRSALTERSARLLDQQLRATVPLSPFGLDALQLKITVPGGCSMVSVMLVRVSVGFTPVQLLFGYPATCAETVGGAVRTAGFVVNVRLPFLI